MRQKLTTAIAIAALLGVLVACAAPASSPTPTASTTTPALARATVTPTPQSTPTPNAATQLAIGLATLGLPTPIPAGRISWRNEITSVALANNLIGDPATRYFHIYLPPGYETGDNHYPVVYVLQGFPGEGVDFMALAARLDELIATGDAREMILVFFDGVNSFGGSWFGSSPTIGDYETFIAEELVALIDTTYRTLPARDSRGITGCFLGGYGSLHLALTRPDVFSVAAPMSGVYDWEHNPIWETAQERFLFEPQDLNDIHALDLAARLVVALAAAEAPNPGNPPLYLDMPFTLVDGSAHVVPDVFEEINALDPMNDLRCYLDQSIRLNGLLIYQDTDLWDSDGQEWAQRFTQAARDFDQALTESGVDHEYSEVEACHCCADWGPILEFLSDHLAY